MCVWGVCVCVGGSVSRSFPEKRQPCRCSRWESIKKGEEAGGSDTRSPTPHPVTDYTALSLQESGDREAQSWGARGVGQFGDLGQCSSDLNVCTITPWGLL